MTKINVAAYIPLVGNTFQVPAAKELQIEGENIKFSEVTVLDVGTVINTEEPDDENACKECGNSARMGTKLRMKHPDGTVDEGWWGVNVLNDWVRGTTIQLYDGPIEMRWSYEREPEEDEQVNESENE